MKSVSERGNVLFLILIAVVLFAALAFEIAQTERSSGNVDEETIAIQVAEYTQKVALIRLVVQRMMVSQGYSIDEIEMCDGGGVCDTYSIFGTLCSSGANCVFAPEGGGIDASIFNAFDGAVAFFESSFGYTMAGHGTSNILMFHNASSLEMCQKMQSAFGLSETIEAEQTADGVTADGIPSLYGQWDLCYDSMAFGAPNTYAARNLIATN